MRSIALVREKYRADFEAYARHFPDKKMGCTPDPEPCLIGVRGTDPLNYWERRLSFLGFPVCPVVQVQLLHRRDERLESALMTSVSLLWIMHWTLASCQSSHANVEVAFRLCCQDSIWDSWKRLCLRPRWVHWLKLHLVNSSWIASCTVVYCNMRKTAVVNIQIGP